MEEEDAHFNKKKFIKCLCCDFTGTPRAFNTHLTKAHSGAANYYTSIYNKKDMLTGETIEFKNLQAYMDTDFNSRENCQGWYKKIGNLDYFVKKIRERCDRKKTLFAPTEAELKSLKLLAYSEAGRRTQSYVNNLATFCAPRFKYNFVPELKDNIKTYIMDTREKKPLRIKGMIETKLNVGDYTAAGDQFANVFIERKSKLDFISTFSFNKIERFEREVKRAVKMDAYIVVLVEENLEICLDYVPGKYSLQKSNGSTAFAGMRQIMADYTNIQFLFVENRATAVKWMGHILSEGVDAKKVDWQFIYNTQIK